MSAKRGKKEVTSSPKTEAETAEKPVQPEVVEETVVEAETIEEAEEAQPGLEVAAGAVRPVELGERLRLQRESTARWLALLVVGIFGLAAMNIIVCGFLSSLIAFLVATVKGTAGVTPPTFDALEAAKILLPYLATALGVALGYYFTRRAEEQRP